MKNQCKENGKATINQSFTFPLPRNTTINLISLHNNMKKHPWVTTHYDNETNKGNPSYITIHFYYDNTKQSMNIFRNGKCRAWYTIQPKAFRFFLDFFYYSIIIDCLEDLE